MIVLLQNKLMNGLVEGLGASLSGSLMFFILITSGTSGIFIGNPFQSFVSDSTSNRSNALDIF